MSQKDPQERVDVCTFCLRDWITPLMKSLKPVASLAEVVQDIGGFAKHLGTK